MPIPLIISNSSKEKLVIVIEPWAEEYSVQPGKKIEVFPINDSKDPVEVNFIGDKLVIYINSDDFRVISDGMEVSPFS